MGIADELITRGWTQGRIVNRDGEVCLMGAAIAAYSDAQLLLDDFDLWDQLPETVRLALAVVCGGDPTNRARVLLGIPVYIFNDNANGFDEVLRAAKEADELLDAS
jgi:hypothetical protein